MSTTTTTATATVTAPALSAPLRERPTPLSRLAGIELRKMVDTRAGRWLLAIIALLLVGTPIVFGLAADAADRTFTDFYRMVMLPTSVLLPVLGILSITSEWSQRTALTTFTLVPNRLRVVAAKLLAILALTAAVIAVSIVVAAIGNLVLGGDGSWSFGADTLGETFLLQLLGLLGGFAFGLLLQSSAPAIVLYYTLPGMWSVLTQVATGIQDVARWLDIGQTTVPLAQGAVSPTDWGRLGTSVAVWVLIPLLIGLWRLARTDVAS